MEIMIMSFNPDTAPDQVDLQIKASLTHVTFS